MPYRNSFEVECAELAKGVIDEACITWAADDFDMTEDDSANCFVIQFMVNE